MRAPDPETVRMVAKLARAKAQWVQSATDSTAQTEADRTLVEFAVELEGIAADLDRQRPVSDGEG